MIVKELIKLLEAHPQEAKIVVFAVDTTDGYDEVNETELVDMVHFPESHGPEYFTPDLRKKEKTMKVVRIW